MFAALQLLCTDAAPPVIEDYGIEAPAGPVSQEGWACPLNLPPVEADSEPARLSNDFAQEMSQMRSWYELALQGRGKTTVGASGVPVEELADFICTLLQGSVPVIEEPVAPPGRLVNLVADDIRALYAEALTAQPGQSLVSAEQLGDWFYLETAAGAALYALRRMGDASTEEGVAEIAGAVAFPARLAGRR